MKFPSGLLVVLASLPGALSLPAWADPGYRLVAITDNGAPVDLISTDLNRRGEVVGSRSTDHGLRAFRWRAGQFTDLHDTLDSTSLFTQAVAINDRSTIAGVRYDNALESFKALVLRGTQVTPLTVVPGENQVFPLDINNRGQIIVDSDGGAQDGSFLVDGDHVQQLENLPGADSLNAIAINERGDVAANSWSAAGSRAVLWQDGVATDLGVVDGASASFAYALNDRQQVVGIVSVGFASHAMIWQNGVMTLLPRLTPDEASSTPSGINNWGVIVGGTTVIQPEFRATATLWLGNHVVELDSLVRADDPLKPFVHLTSASMINDLGDIVVAGVDSRAPDVRTTYFMTLFGN